MTASHWDELGIEPTTDRARIRRAYAGRLKTIRPDREPAAFQRLRTAYEEALRDTSTATETPDRPKPDDLRGGQEPDPAADRARAVIAAALDRDDAAGAFAAFTGADELGLLSLVDLDAIEERLLGVAAPDRKLSPEQLLQIVRRFRWDNSIHPLRRRRAQTFAVLDARLDAERWYGELVDRAQKPRGFYESDDRLAARQLLSGPPSWWRRHGFPNRSPWLGRELTAYGRHSEWVGDRFDPQRIFWCRGRRTNRKAHRAIVAIWIAFGLFILLITAQGPSSLLVFVFVVMMWLIIYLMRQSRSAR